MEMEPPQQTNFNIRPQSHDGRGLCNICGFRNARNNNNSNLNDNLENDNPAQQLQLMTILRILSRYKNNQPTQNTIWITVTKIF